MGTRPARDIDHDAWLAARGVTVLRIPARELTRRMDELADAIIQMAAQRL
jgi:very-short-patch-repair endonuclease